MSVNTSIVQKKPSSIWLILSFAIASVGIYGMIQVFAHGQEESYGISREFPWGLLLVGYVFLVVSSTGLCLISSLGHLWGFKQFIPITKRALWLSFAMLIGGFYIIFWELGGPFDLQVMRLIKYFVPFHYKSPILWMGVLYGLYMVFLLLEFYFLISKEWKKAFIFGMFGFFIGIAAHSNLGAVFGFNISRPFWHGVFLPIYFILSALISGSALSILIQYFSNAGKFTEDSDSMRTLSSLAKILVLLLGIMLFFEIWKTITSLYGHPTIKYEAMKTLITGPLSVNFLLFEMGIGVILPSILLLLSSFKSPFIILLSAIFVIIGIYFMRFDLVYAGQIVAVTSGYLPKITYVKYTPTLAEYTLFLSSIGVVGIVYFLGAKFFDLEEETHNG